jgi:two-component system nitrate/nitrite sensor histidine kinase NarQ
VGGAVGLQEAAEGLAGEYVRSAPPGQAPVSITIDVTDEASTGVPSERRAELVQVLREAIANAVRHGRATSLTITGRIEGGKLVLAVTDDGVGFDVSGGAKEGHHGLRNMANRARMLDGHLKIDSAPGQGTTITIVAPLAG